MQELGFVHTKGEIAKMMSQIDEDGSGTIDEGEFMAMMSSRKESAWSSLKKSILQSHLRLLSGASLKLLRATYFAEIDDKESW